jgi:hypothetical protein
MLQLNEHLKRRVRQIAIIGLQLGAIGCIFPTQNPAIQWWAAQSHFIALIYLSLGLFCLVINWPRLMFVCMGCSAVICFFYHEKENRPDLNKSHIESTMPPRSENEKVF